MGWQFPDRDKLNRLRADGVVSYSVWITSLMILISVICYLLTFIGDFYLDLQSYFQALQATPALMNKQVFLSYIGKYLLRPILLLLAIILIVGLLQTRFYFSFSQLGWNFNRLGMKSNLLVQQPIKKILFAISLPIGLILITLLIQNWLNKFNSLGSLNLCLEEQVCFTFFQSVLRDLLIVLILLVLLSLIVQYLYFRIEHRQTDQSESSDSDQGRSIDRVR